MQPPIVVPPMSSGKNASGFQRRQGQELWRAFIAEDPTRAIYTGRLPTGYGKTEAILDGYAELRERIGCSRLLIVVPTSTQEDAYANELAAKAKAMGIKVSKVIVADAAGRTLRYHQRNEAEVFVMTVQRLVSSVTGRNRRGNWLTELLHIGRWCGAADEYHHYADNNIWGTAFRGLVQVCPWLALSATPDRRQGETIFGKPLVDVSYADALKEGETREPVVKDVIVKVREYGVDIQVGNGDVLTRTTSDLREEINTERIDEWEARKQLRYLTKYCSPILVHAIGELNDYQLNAPVGAHPQMLVYAFSCAHAKSLCQIIAGHAPGLRVDWAGTGPNGRSDCENKDVINRFKGCSEPASLDVLVQVNIASEGFNCLPICIIVDLSMTGFGPQKLQAYGRGTRAYFGFHLTIFIPTDSNVARLAHLRAGLFDLPVDTEAPSDKCDCCSECPRCEHHEERPKVLPDIHVLNAMLIGGRDFQPSAAFVAEYATHLPKSRRLDVEHNAEDFQEVHDALVSFYRMQQSQQSEVVRLAYWQDKVRHAVGAVARNVLLKTRGSVEKSLLGDLCKRLNARWKYEHGSHDNMTAVQFEDKYAWLDRVNKNVIQGSIPLWLA